MGRRFVGWRLCRTLDGRRLRPRYAFLSRQRLRAGQGLRPRRGLRLQRPHAAFPEGYCPGQGVACGNRTRHGDLTPRCRSAQDVRLDHHIAWPADHKQVLDIVAAHKNETAPVINGGLVDYGQPRLASARSGKRPSPAPAIAIVAKLRRLIFV